MKELLLAEEANERALAKTISATPRANPLVVTTGGNAWNTPTLAVETSSQGSTFRSIIDSVEATVSRRSQRRPLHVIQAEERAMAELRVAYNVAGNFDERITVERASVIDQPVHHDRHDLSWSSRI